MLKVVRRNKAQIDKLLFSIKLLIIREGKKIAWDFIMQQIPTEQQVITKMDELIRDNPKKAKRYYDKLHALLLGIHKKLQSSLVQIDTIRTKLDQVNQKMIFLATIATFIDPLVDQLKALKTSSESIIVGAGSTPGAPPGPVATASTLKDKLKGAIHKMIGAVSLAIRVVKIVTRTYFALKLLVDQAHSKITQLLSYIDDLIATLEALFLEKLAPLLEGDLEDQPDIGTLDDLYEFYPGLEGYLNQDDTPFVPPPQEEENNTTDGISNIAPRFYKRYRTGSIENSNTEE